MRKKRQPTSPGEILREEFLLPLGMTQKELADHLGCEVKVINRLVNGRTSVSAEMALKLGATFRTSPEFWLNAAPRCRPRWRSSSARRFGLRRSSG
jgi:addiction module HigA family antidote